MKSFSDNIVEKEQLPKTHANLVVGLLITNIVFQLIVAGLIYVTLTQPVYLQVDHPEQSDQPKVESST